MMANNTMKEIREEEIKKLAELARIRLRPSDMSSLTKDIAALLEYVGQIASESSKTRVVDETGSSDLRHRNVFRADVAAKGLDFDSNTLVEGAPRRQKGYISVKRILP